MKTRCKFTVVGIETRGEGRAYKLRTVYDPDIPSDQIFAALTPGGSLEFDCQNQTVIHDAGLELGAEFYVDLTPVTKE